MLDLIQAPAGRHVPGELFVWAMLDWPDVKRWQVAQTAADVVEFRLVVAQPWSEAQRHALAANVASTCGDSPRVRVVEVDAIALTPSGKRRLTLALSR